MDSENKGENNSPELSREREEFEFHHKFMSPVSWLSYPVSEKDRQKGANILSEAVPSIEKALFRKRPGEISPSYYPGQIASIRISKENAKYEEPLSQMFYSHMDEMGEQIAPQYDGQDSQVTYLRLITDFYRSRQPKYSEKAMDILARNFKPESVLKFPPSNIRLLENCLAIY